jgi:hypothetical protein
MMRARLTLAALCFTWLVIGTPAKADDPIAAARTVIESQISAFLKDDAESAYSFASPRIKNVFPNKEQFFEMVRKSYEPVYHPGNYAFGRNKILSDGAVVLQEVLISGREGKDWTAVYELGLQPDGSYKINGVQMLKNTTSTGI